MQEVTDTYRLAKPQESESVPLEGSVQLQVPFDLSLAAFEESGSVQWISRIYKQSRVPYVWQLTVHFTCRARLQWACGERMPVKPLIEKSPCFCAFSSSLAP